MAEPATDAETRAKLVDALAKATPLGKGRWDLCWDGDEHYGFDGIIFRPEHGDDSAPIFSDGAGSASPNVSTVREQDRRDFELLVLLRNAAESLLADANALDAERAARETAEARAKVLREALGFAASVIKSGESWTDTCEQVIASALKEPSNG